MTNKENESKLSDVFRLIKYSQVRFWKLVTCQLQGNKPMINVKWAICEQSVFLASGAARLLSAFGRQRALFVLQHFSNKRTQS